MNAWTRRRDSAVGGESWRHTGSAVADPLAAEVDLAVKQLRPRRLEAFRIDRVARALGLELRRRRLGQGLHGLTVDERRVLLSRRVTGKMAVFTFAHEVAHVLARRGSFQALSRGHEEWLADRFAHELILPRQWLEVASLAELRRLSRAHWLPAETFVVQLASVDRAPSLFRSGDAVYCRHCGHRHVLPGCGCRSYRGALDRRRPAVGSVPDIESVIRRVTEPFVQPSLPLFIHRRQGAGCRASAGVVGARSAATQR